MDLQDQEMINKPNLEQKLEFVNPLSDAPNYRETQKELISAAQKVSGGDPLGALTYIVTCLSHEGYDVEFHMVFITRETHEPYTEKELKEQREEEEWAFRNDDFYSRDDYEEYENDEVIIELPIIETEPKDELGYYVSWGDGTITHNNNKHTYKMKKDIVEYDVKFFGFGIAAFGAPANDKYFGYRTSLTKVITFGNLGHNFVSLKNAFNSCRCLHELPLTLPKTIKNTSKMFFGCSYMNEPIDMWDVSNVEDMSGMFKHCEFFNQPLNTWDVSFVKNMSEMFCYSTNFKQSIDCWDTSSVTNMQSMFYGCGHQVLASMNSWDVSKVTNMQHMFAGCAYYDQPMDAWDVSSVVNMRGMFSGCKIFNQPLNSWALNKQGDPKVECENMFSNCLQFDQPLDNWRVGPDFNKAHTIRSYMFHGCCKSDDFMPAHPDN